MKRTNWDQLAEEYASRDFPERDWNFGYENVLNLLRKIAGEKILDYGCGSGKFSRVLAERGAQVLGIDTNETMVDLARRQDCKNIYYGLPEDISSLGYFDGAVLNYVICGMRDDIEVKEVLRGIYTQLKLNGLLIVLDPHPATRTIRTDGEPNEVVLEGMTKPVLDYWRPVDKYISIVSRVGFTIDNVLEPKNEEGIPQMLIIKGKKNV